MPEINIRNLDNSRSSTVDSKDGVVAAAIIKRTLENNSISADDYKNIVSNFKGGHSDLVRVLSELVPSPLVASAQIMLSIDHMSKTISLSDRADLHEAIDMSSHSLSSGVMEKSNVSLSSSITEEPDVRPLEGEKEIIDSKKFLSSPTDKNLIKDTFFQQGKVDVNIAKWTSIDESVMTKFTKDFVTKLKDQDPDGSATKYVLDHITRNFENLDEEGSLREAEENATGRTIKTVHTMIKTGIGDLVEDIGLTHLKQRFPEPDFRVISSVSTSVGHEELDYMILSRSQEEKKGSDGPSFKVIALGTAKTQLEDCSLKTDLSRLKAILESSNTIRFCDENGTQTTCSSDEMRKLVNGAPKNAVVPKNIKDIGVSPGPNADVARLPLKDMMLFGLNTDAVKSRFLAMISLEIKNSYI